MSPAFEAPPLLDAADQSIQSATILMLRELGQTARADQSALSLVERLSSHPHQAIALFSSKPSLLGAGARSLLVSKPYLSLLGPTCAALSHYCPAASASAIEALLDCPDPSLSSQIIAGLPRPPRPGPIAASLRRSFDSAQAARRLASARRLGLLGRPLLLLLARHSGWCDNGVAQMAQSFLELRALTRSVAPFKEPARRRGPRI